MSFALKASSDGGSHDGHRSKQAPILRRWPEQSSARPPRSSGAGATAHAPLRATLYLQAGRTPCSYEREYLQNVIHGYTEGCLVTIGSQVESSAVPLRFRLSL